MDIVDEDEHTRIMRCGEACPILLCLEITIDRSQLENAHGETSVVGIATKSGDRHGVVVVRLHESLDLYTLSFYQLLPPYIHRLPCWLFCHA